MFVKITRTCRVAGDHRAAGDVCELDNATAAHLISIGRAEKTAAPAPKKAVEKAPAPKK